MFVKCHQPTFCSLLTIVRNSSALTTTYGDFKGNYKVHRWLPKKCEKHKLREWRKERGDKVKKIELIDFHEPSVYDISPQEQRLKMKRLGIHPSRPWEERPVYMDSTGTVIDKYVPVEGDGKSSLISLEGARQRKDQVFGKTRNYRALRKIYAYDEDFHIKDFGFQARDLYVEALQLLADNEFEKLKDCTNPRAYAMLTELVHGKQIRWKYLKSLEPPLCVSVRTQKLDEESASVQTEMLFAQITVRIHSQQTLAIYDRFGNLMYGNENVAVDNLEYIVFEKNVSSTNGVWRIHDRILPEWTPTAPSSLRTYKMEAEKEETEKPMEEVESQEQKEEQKGEKLEMA